MLFSDIAWIHFWRAVGAFGERLANAACCSIMLQYILKNTKISTYRFSFRKLFLRFLKTNKDLEKFHPTTKQQLNHQIKLQVLEWYTDTRTSLEQLDSYPAVKKVFMHSNNPLCSSAPLERISNFAGIWHMRGAITPKNFEMCVFLKGTQVYK